MKTFSLAVLIFVLSINVFAQQADIVTVFQGIRIKNDHREEALFYYRNNWAKLREAAVKKNYIHSFELVEVYSERDAKFDIGLVTRFTNQAQSDKAEVNFQELISARGKLRLLNDRKPGEFRESIVVATFNGDYFAFPGLPEGSFGLSQRRIKLENEGWELVGDLTLPLTPRPAPAVILLNKAYGTREAYEGLAKKLAREGIASLRLDLRAHGDSTNKGKFGPPFDEKMRALLKGSDRDIGAAHEWMTRTPGIDKSRIGIVGASYSGEEMVAAAAKTGFAKSYVALSPGSFSERSSKTIDTNKIPWLFIKSVDEIALMKDVFAMVRSNSKTARMIEVSGKKHASDILLEQPDVEDIVVLWFKQNL
ncbi:MAG: hypothetical protein HKN33_11325 [Pyrinomonadaceae bacterium]|nr:hypothetical protein [Pyrinomonadaceae bacterium]